MRAARTHQFGPPETLLIADVRLPTPGAGKAQVRIHDRGANSMDTLARTWGYGSEPLANFFFGRDLHLPHAPGIEPAGVV